MATTGKIETGSVAPVVFEGAEFPIPGSGLDAGDLVVRLGDRPLAIVRRTANQIIARAPWEPDCAPIFVEIGGTVLDAGPLAVRIRPPDVAPPIDPPPPPTDKLRELALETIRLTNEERAKAGLRAVVAAVLAEGEIGAAWQSLSAQSERQLNAPGLVALTEHASLAKSAQSHATDQGVNNYFSHTSLDGRSPFARMKDAGYNGGSLAENIARGFTTPAMVLSAWMNSSGHRSNLLSANFMHIGVGVATWSGNGYVWVQNFGGGAR